MREIKFRGKRLDNGEWLYGNLVELRNPFNPNDAPACFIMPKEVNIAAPDSISEQEVVDPDTIGQFTGLHDKNGKEIYEGDIVKWILTMPEVGVNGGYEEYETEEIGEIQWDAGALHLGEYCAAGFAYDSEDYAEIIGNIHDNPELLNQ